MPELPEVETIKRQLAEEIIGKKLSGKKISGVRRRAKILIIDFQDGSSLIFHLKMTGQLIVNGETLRYTRKVFKFSDGSWLTFNDVRKFGWWKMLKKGSAEKEKEFGLEPLEIKLVDFLAVLKKHPRAKIKPLLMNQKVIAGIGNIYSDEILFAAKVNPIRLAGSLKEKEAIEVFKKIKKILKMAIKLHGSSVEDYFDARGDKGDFVSRHKIYQKEGRPCSECGTIIKKIKVNGRSARYCPKCQPIGRKRKSRLATKSKL